MCSSSPVRTPELQLAAEQPSIVECSVQFSSFAQSCPTLCDAMNRSTPGLPVHCQLLEFSQEKMSTCPSTLSACSHEIKRHLLLARKVMTNIESILKSRDITLPMKICLVKAMVFALVMYGCESWAIKKAEHQRIDAF